MKKTRILSLIIAVFMLCTLLAGCDDGAKTVMKEHVPLSSVASYCGFANYSTFYRAYVKNFGHSPKEEM